MKFLVCGGLGFIGSAFVRNHLENFPSDKIINLDNFSLGSNAKNVESVEKNPNYSFIKESITNLEQINKIAKDVDVIVNFAAETHVDRSIANPLPFIQTNIVGTYSLLEAAKKHEKLFIHVSTDEVYGDAEGKDSFVETDLLSPSNPYSATKASADHLVKAYCQTYGIKCIITRCTNNFGPYQFPEKLIPKTIIRALKDLPIPLHGEGTQIRSWIYVQDHIEAIEKLLSKGKSGEIYNIASNDEITNRKIVEKILKIIKKPLSLIHNVEDRPGQDKKYSLNASKIHELMGWQPRFQFDTALAITVNWYVKNTQWWEPLATDEILHPQPWTLGSFHYKSNR